MDRTPESPEPKLNPLALPTTLDNLDCVITALVSNRHAMDAHERTMARVLAARLRYHAETIDVTISTLPEGRSGA